MGGVISTFLSADTIRPLLSYVGGEAKYIWDSKGEFDCQKEDMRNEVELAEQRARTRRTTSVKRWFERVDRGVTEVERLQQERDQEIDRLCLGGLCSKDLISSYSFGKRVENMKNKVIELKKEGEAINQLYEEVPEDAAVAIAVERTIVGQESILDRVWRCIIDQEKNKGIIGLYGTGGVGKTTLLKQVNNKFCSDEQHRFDVVIWSVVSREPNLKQIQEDIGKRIGFSEKSWLDKSFEERASDITNTLSRQKFVLLLDNIWDSKFNLTELGVPLHSGSKIVFTTRFQGTCGKMRADKKFEVSYLRDDDAWKLFQEVGGFYFDSHSEIRELAKTMASQCHGLPLALETVGQAMAGKEYPEEWRRAIEIISTSASKFEDMEKKVLSRLNFSYDSLSKDELRSCLLYCCLFPEDSEIRKIDLMEYWKSEGFLDSIGGWDVLGALVRACLLEEAGDHVKMHDMIREMGIWIANEIEKEEENFLVRAGVELTDAPKVEEWEGVKRISLMNCGIQSLPEIPTCPRPQTLLLENNRIKEITDSFFQSFSSLRVLSLRGNGSLTELPVGISSLVSLHHLDLSFTGVRGLPQELKALVLRMLLCGFWHPPIVEEGNVLSDDAESLMKEIHCLEQLNLISLSIGSSRGLLNITQALSIREWESLPLHFLHVANLENLEQLMIWNSNLEEWNIDWTGEIEKVLQSGVFRNLQRVIIHCSNVKDLTWLAFVRNLKELAVDDCYDIEEIISVEKLSEVSEMMGELNLFAKLETLTLGGASNLKRIYRDPLPFPQLKQINVWECPKLEKLPLNSSSAKGRTIVIRGEEERWEELQREDQATQNALPAGLLPDT
ncbi:hypothetical protein CUMW_261470 [Citrus unshiu]|uniref:Uncharacterized protein n=1 Tax=Citrus unshiu TaxID=55188 RepID=A0A2H5QTZ4_CITUN|nr:hypothetical protein CUMW_261470 [Citrus unshiu]